METTDFAGLQLDNWLMVGLACAIAATAALIAFWVVRRVAATHWLSATLVGKVLRNCETMLQWLLVASALQFVLGFAPEDLARLGALQHAVGVVMIFAATFTLTAAIDAVGKWVVSRQPIDIEDNLRARQLQTQLRVITRTAKTVVVIIGIAVALMSFETARKFGVSLLASAGVAGLIVGLAAKSVLGNLLAGLQIAITQPIRLDDVLIVENEWGRVEEITSTYVVFRVWDERRLIVPLQYFIEQPFQNWTRKNANIMGSVTLWLDYGVPLDGLRTEAQRLIEAASEWDRRFWNLQVVDASERAMQVRVLLTSHDSSANWTLKCKVREGLIDYLRRTQPEALPRIRAEVGDGLGEGRERRPADQPAAH